MAEVVIFAPSPLLTVSVEGQADQPAIHVHAGGQGLWQARMLLRIGASVTMTAVMSGEQGRVLRHLIADEGIILVAVERDGEGGAYVHDRRSGERVIVAETGGDPLSRHDLDELYGITLRCGLDADLIILSGPAGEAALPADVYRRLASDLRAAGKRVVVDLAGDRLAAALEGGVFLAKVSHEELLADGRITENSVDQIVRAMRALHEQGAETVIVTRADQPLLLLSGDAIHEVTTPKMQVADGSGAGDSLTAGVAASLAGGNPIERAITLGAAAGALNVTRHGLGTGDAETIAKLRELVVVRRIDTKLERTTRLSPDQLAANTTEIKIIDLDGTT